MVSEWEDRAREALAQELVDAYEFPEANARRLAATLVEWSLPQYGDEE